MVKTINLPNQIQRLSKLNTLDLSLVQSVVTGAGSLSKLQHSARLVKTFPVWWVRKAENKAYLSQLELTIG